jgi:hypothetical protein
MELPPTEIVQGGILPDVRVTGFTRRLEVHDPTFTWPIRAFFGALLMSPYFFQRRDLR